MKSLSLSPEPPLQPKSDGEKVDLKIFRGRHHFRFQVPLQGDLLLSLWDSRRPISK
jgi:hypothetical protein